jgi:uncharacterized MAPEG superfamily protein
MDLFKNYNISILAIPAYYIMAVLPHFYAVNVVKKNDPTKWDNSRPRSQSMKEELKTKLSAEEYGRYERAEAASANAVENLPLFASAVIVANAAGMTKDGQAGLDAFVGAWFAIRAAHSLSYIYISDSKMSYLRSALWIASLGLCFKVFGQAARVLNHGLA